MVVVAGRVVVGSIVVIGVAVAVTAADAVGAGVGSVLGVSVPANVGGAEAPLLLQAVNASAARPRQAQGFIVSTHRLQSLPQP